MADHRPARSPGGLGDRFDAWAAAGGTTRTSLGRFRVLYGLVVLLMLPDYAWVSHFPDAMYAPPPGPFALLGGFPPVAVLHGLELLLAVAALALLVGWRTRTASVVVTLASMAGNGATYSLGKIDHTILVVLIPLPMALAGWGDRVSVDAVRRSVRGRAPVAERALQWPLRLTAAGTGVAFLTAALPKLRSGWLSPSSQAVQGQEMNQYYTHDRHDLLAPFFVGFTNRPFWEVLDVATVALESLVVVAALWWAATRLAFAVATLFHAGVLMIMNIAFWVNVLSYAFVVPWDRVPLPARLRGQGPAWLRRPRAEGWVGAGVVVVGAGWWALDRVVGSALRSAVSQGVVLAGAAVVVVCAAVVARTWWDGRRGRGGEPVDGSKAQLLATAARRAS